jgi:hypothetical protein
MDRDWLRRQAASRTRATEAMMAAVAAAESRAPSRGAVADSIAAVKLACWDPTLDPGDRLALIDDALLMMTPLKELAGAAQAARPELILETYRRTNDLLRHYAQFVRAERASS